MGLAAARMKRQASLVGVRAPGFRLQDQDERWVELADVTRAGAVVLTFYPADFSPVCTRQWCDYRDARGRFELSGVRMVGISPDSPARHREFITLQQLTFQLLSDPDLTAFRAYGAFSKWLPMKTRACFVIDRTGIVRYEKVEPTMFTHRDAADLLAAIRDLEGSL